jgi:hypothetical protein
VQPTAPVTSLTAPNGVVVSLASTQPQPIPTPQAVTTLTAVTTTLSTVHNP